jgi:hypothetical protein
MKEATLLSTKKIHDDQGDHNDRGSSILISMITLSLVGSSSLRIHQEIQGPNDDRHQKPRQTSAITSNQDQEY